MDIQISQKEHLRIGDKYPICFEIDGLDYGVMAVFHYYKSGLFEVGKAELRQKESEYALFLFKYDELELPEWWQDSKLIWKLELAEGKE